MLGIAQTKRTAFTNLENAFRGKRKTPGKSELKNRRNCKFYIYKLGPDPETISMVCDEKGGNPHNKKDTKYSM